MFIVKILFFVLAILTLLVLIRFLWMIPNELRDIKMHLLYYRNKDEHKELDPDVVKSIEREVAEKFINSSTLR